MRGGTRSSASGAPAWCSNGVPSALLGFSVVLLIILGLVQLVIECESLSIATPSYLVMVILGVVVGGALARCFMALRSMPLSMAQVPPLFHDLVGNDKGGCLIPEATHRAISIEQIRRLVGHVERRFDDGEVLSYTPEYEGATLRTISKCIKTKRQTSESQVYGYEPEYEEYMAMDANLYDLDKLVIRPATKMRQCSMVELMAEGEQAPDYFVSHAWAEAVVHFLVCLEQHSEDRGLEKEPDEASHYPHKAGFYLGGSAYANNQWKLATEISEDLHQTSFFKAMNLPTTRGTVSIVDAKGVCFGRIWCVFELYHALVSEHHTGYTYDLYTAQLHGYEQIAVGITDGLAVVDCGASDKNNREAHFPFALLDKAIAFKCMEGKASVPEDEARIKAEICHHSDVLDATVHGVIAASALVRALEEGGERRETYLEAVTVGHVRKLQIALTKHSDTKENVAAVINALDKGLLQELTMTTTVDALPERLVDLTALTALDLQHCRGLTSLPGSLGDLTALTSLRVDGCRRLTSLPESLGELKALTKLSVHDCGCLTSLPERLGELKALTKLGLSWCYGLTFLPESVGNLKALTALDLGSSSHLTSLPESVGNLKALTDLNLSYCEALTFLPESLDNLRALSTFSMHQVGRGRSSL